MAQMIEQCGGNQGQLPPHRINYGKGGNVSCVPNLSTLSKPEVCDFDG
jgi:hypothetical protein